MLTTSLNVYEDRRIATNSGSIKVRSDIPGSLFNRYSRTNIHRIDRIHKSMFIEYSIKIHLQMFIWWLCGTCSWTWISCYGKRMFNEHSSHVHPMSIHTFKWTSHKHFIHVPPLSEGRKNITHLRVITMIYFVSHMTKYFPKSSQKHIFVLVGFMLDVL